ncbi:hypothetical protein GCM10011507_21470 [Edaphobacter acidisoli]|uniref:DUF2252 domain-containing protein n=1 Tax=Edaphobacter acidisoli TaxID=2040573 RepID=A0A916RTG9_9BACT|nr:hypothetical protein GCM10011507_21470 [Edaphobacter acidisoli]
MTDGALSVKERFRLGRDRRKQIRRLEHSAWDVKLRKEDPLKLMARSMQGRVPHLIKMKYGLMAASPFGYFRGAVPVMAYDLSRMGHTGIVSQLCGDAHVRNLGAFAAPDGRLVFDINDFDETIRGPFEWDVKRMAASLVLAGRTANVKGADCRDAAAVFAEQYRSMMTQFAQMTVLDVVRYQVHRLKMVETVEGILRAAERATPMHTLLALTEPKGVMGKSSKQNKKKAPENQLKGERIFKTIKPSLKRVTGEIAEKVITALGPYASTLQPERRHFLAQYRPLDVAFKVVGTGSVGLRDYCVYMQGNGENDPLFLQVKEEVESGYAPYLESGAKRKQHQGHRVVDGERAMQLQSDPFLGWTTMDGRDYLVRQLNDHKASIQLEGITATGLMEYAGVCGELLARGHARSGDACVLAGYLGRSSRFDEAVVAFAETYADQTEADWKELVGWLKRTRGQIVSSK